MLHERSRNAFLSRVASEQVTMNDWDVKLTVNSLIKIEQSQNFQKHWRRDVEDRIQSFLLEQVLRLFVCGSLGVDTLQALRNCRVIETHGVYRQIIQKCLSTNAGAAAYARADAAARSQPSTSAGPLVLGGKLTDARLHLLNSAQQPAPSITIESMQFWHREKVISIGYDKLRKGLISINGWTELVQRTAGISWSLKKAVKFCVDDGYFGEATHLARLLGLYKNQQAVEVQKLWNKSELQRMGAKFGHKSFLRMSLLIRWLP